MRRKIYCSSIVEICRELEATEISGQDFTSGTQDEQVFRGPRIIPLEARSQKVVILRFLSGLRLASTQQTEQGFDTGKMMRK